MTSRLDAKQPARESVASDYALHPGPFALASGGSTLSTSSVSTASTRSRLQSNALGRVEGSPSHAASRRQVHRTSLYLIAVLHPDLDPGVAAPLGGSSTRFVKLSFASSGREEVDGDHFFFTDGFSPRSTSLRRPGPSPSSAGQAWARALTASETARRCLHRAPKPRRRGWPT